MLTTEELIALRDAARHSEVSLEAMVASARARNRIEGAALYLAAEVLRLRAREAAGVKLAEAVDAYRRLMLPTHMQIAYEEMAGNEVPDEVILSSFMGGGASDIVTVGMFREAERHYASWEATQCQPKP